MYGFRSLDHRPHSVPEGARLRRLSAFRPLPERSPTTMKLSVVYQPAVPASTSPYRVRDEKGEELGWPTPSSMVSASGNSPPGRFASTPTTFLTSPAGSNCNIGR